MSDKSDKIYLDSCAYIELIKSKTAHAVDPDRLDHVWYCRQFLDAAAEGKVRVLGSALLVSECTHIKDATNRKIFTDDVKKAFNAVFMSGKVVLPILPTPQIIEYSRDLLWEHNLDLKPMDSLHIATAAIYKCVVFITTDNRILNHADDIFGVTKMKVCQGHEAHQWLPKQFLQNKLSLSGTATEAKK